VQVTDNGNFVLDVDMGAISAPGELANTIKLLTGVVEVGLFINMATKAYLGADDGSAAVRLKLHP
jgi:ribose 5-phosphate isomerase A